MVGTIKESADKVIADADFQGNGKADRIAGSGKQIKGSIKMAAGKLVGDDKLRADGKADRVKGKVQNLVGTIEDSLKK
jgi:uncharacterized protein YjbJ (UPF0337 family)